MSKTQNLNLLNLFSDISLSFKPTVYDKFQSANVSTPGSTFHRNAVMLDFELAFGYK